MTDALIGRTLHGGEYRIEEVIARGGQATVYRAYARQLDIDVAIKVLDQNLAADREFRERFHDEARVLAKLHHKNLVDVKSYDEEAELVYIVMRLVPGGTLKDRLQALGGALGLTDAARTIGQIAEAVQHAHDQGVLHLDIKPANVLLGQADWPLVTDLGLTRAIQRDHTDAGHSRVAGTPAYMSPEQCRGGAIDERSDQYSLAVTAYELLTGQQPFHARTTEALLQQHLETAPPRPREINPGLPGPIEEVLLRGLAKDPGDRFPRIADFGQALTEAVERTRGVSLEAKLAAAATAPNLLAILALVLAAPFMLAILPVGNVLGRLPLAWPFQLLLAGSIAALLLGIRWHLIGLAGRGVGGSLAALDRLSRRQVMLGTGIDGPLHVKAWQRTAVAAVEGMVNMLYVLATYRLVGAPALAVARTLLDPAAYRLLDTIVLVLVGGLVVSIIAGIFRAAGPVPATLVLALAWAAAITLPTFEVDLWGAETLALTAQLVVAAGLLLLLGAQRRSAGEALGRLASETVGRLLTEGRPGVTPEQSAASARQIERLAYGVLDFGYLLLGYALLRTPLVGLLSPFTTPVAAAIVATALACAIWLVLIVRLHWTAGVVGVMLGVVLGAPVLVSLPVFDSGVIQARWPATIASWGAAGALLLLLAVLRGPTQSVGRTALGARLDRGLLGASAASTEEQSARRAGALGGVAGAFIDVCFLLIGYWVIGVPISNALIRMTHEPALGSVVLLGVLLAALGLTLAPSRRAASTLVETGGAQWRGRSRAFTVVALAAAAMLIAFGGAAPAAVAGPTVLSPAAFTPELGRVSARVIVDRDVWLPWSPLPEQATYNLALSCSDGRSIGQFHEVFEPVSGSPMPAGGVGPLGLTNVGCDEWQRLYQARRHAAGLADAPSLSWEWLHVQATVNDDLSTDVVETQRVFFSAGEHDSLTWDLGAPGATRLSNLEVVSASESKAVNDVHVDESGGQRRVRWPIARVLGPAEQTYTLKYHLTPGADQQSLFEQSVASPERSAPIWQAAVEVRLPARLSQQSFDLVSDGLAARTGVTRDHAAWFEARDLPGGQAFTVVVRATSASSASPIPTVVAPPAGPAPASPAPAPPALPASTPTIEVAGMVVTQNAGTATSSVATSTPTFTPSATLEPAASPQATVAAETTDTPTATATPQIPGGNGEPGQQPTDPTPAPVATVESTATSAATVTVTVVPTPSAAVTVNATTTTLTPLATSTDTSVPTSTATAVVPAATQAPTSTPASHTSHGSTPNHTLSILVVGNGLGTVTSSPGGIACSPTCAADFSEGTSVVLTATPAQGSVFSNWTGGCQSTAGATCTISISAAQSVQANFTRLFRLTTVMSGTGTGALSSVPAGIDCPVTCSAEFASGSSVVLAATPAQGSVFSGWGGACQNATGGTCTVAMTAAQSAQASFTRMFALTTVISGSGAGTLSSVPAGIDCPVTCSAEFASGSSVVLAATPAQGSVFSGWGGACQATTGPQCTVTLSTDTSVSATFAPLVTLSVTLTGNGNVSGPAGIDCPKDCRLTVPSGTRLSLKAAAGEGSTFTAWGGACQDTTELTCSLTLTTDTSVSASFASLLTLTVSAIGTGSGSVTSPVGISCPTTCSVRLPQNSQVALMASPTAGDVFDGWSGGASCARPSDATCQFALTGDTTVSASFSQPTLTVRLLGNGSGAVADPKLVINCPTACTGVFAPEQSVTLSATPREGSFFAGWGGFCTSGPSSSCTAKMDGNQSVTATFTQIDNGCPNSNCRLTVKVDGTGSGKVTSSPSGISCPADCVAYAPYTNPVVLDAQPDAGTVFAGWSGTACGGTDLHCDLLMMGEEKITATFTKGATLTFSAVDNSQESSNSVRSSPAGVDCQFTFSPFGPGACKVSVAYLLGQSVTLTATTCYRCVDTVQWGGACSGVGLSCTVAMKEDQSVSLTFVCGFKECGRSPTPTTVAISTPVLNTAPNLVNPATPEATVTPSPEATVTPSPEATVTPSPTAGPTQVPVATATPTTSPTATVTPTHVAPPTTPTVRPVKPAAGGAAVTKSPVLPPRSP